MSVQMKTYSIIFIKKSDLDYTLSKTREQGKEH